MDERFAGAMTWREFLPGYAASILAAIAIGAWLEVKLGVPEGAAFGFVSSTFFAWGAVGRPRYVFRLIRNIGWFSLIQSDRTMQRTLWALSAGLLVYSLASL